MGPYTVRKVVGDNISFAFAFGLLSHMKGRTFYGGLCGWLLGTDVAVANEAAKCLKHNSFIKQIQLV
jgi:aconitase B